MASARRRRTRSRPTAGAALAFVLLAALGLAALRQLTLTASPPSPAQGQGASLLDRALAQASATLSPPTIEATGPGNLLSAPPSDEPPLRAPVPTPLGATRLTQFSALPLVPDPQLGAQVVQRLAGHSGRFGIAIKDLATGRGVLIDPDGEYQAASLFKLSVMYEVYRQRDRGLVSFGEYIALTPRHVAYDLGTLDRSVGDTIRIDEALERMVTISDNSSAVLLTDRVGARVINQELRGLGMEHTRLIADDLVTSPGDMLTFLEMLALGKAVSPSASAEMVSLMARQRVNDRIPRHLPTTATVAHKTGNLPGVVHDVGIVYGPEATFIIAILVERTADEAEAALIAADLAAASYHHFAGLNGNGGSLPVPTVEATPTDRPVPPPPTSTPQPSATATAEPTATPEPTRTTEAPTPEPTRTPTPTPGLIQTPSVTPTSGSPRPTPTATPTRPPA